MFLTTLYYCLFAWPSKNVFEKLEIFEVAVILYCYFSSEMSIKKSLFQLIMQFFCKLIYVRFYVRNFLIIFSISMLYL